MSNVHVSAALDYQNETFDGFRDAAHDSTPSHGGQEGAFHSVVTPRFEPLILFIDCMWFNGLVCVCFL